jgi:hypothetical protein
MHVDLKFDRNIGVNHDIHLSIYPILPIHADTMDPCAVSFFIVNPKSTSPFVIYRYLYPPVYFIISLFHWPTPPRTFASSAYSSLLLLLTLLGVRVLATFQTQPSEWILMNALLLLQPLLCCVISIGRDAEWQRGAWRRGGGG